MAPPFVLGIAGGSGSGKSTISRAILDALPPGAGVLIRHDVLGGLLHDYHREAA